MTRRATTPELDLVPVLGLTALLIPMLLLGQVESVAVIDNHLPGFCACHGDAEAVVVVPTVMLSSNAIHVLVPGADDITLQPGDHAGLSAALRRVRHEHPVDARLVLVPESQVTHEQLIAAMDAARKPGFSEVTIAGGAS